MITHLCFATAIGIRFRKKQFEYEYLYEALSMVSRGDLRLQSNFIDLLALLNEVPFTRPINSNGEHMINIKSRISEHHK